MLRVLHVSDLHAATNDADDQDEIVKGLLRDVAGTHRESPIDLIVMSGDVAFSGQMEEFVLGDSLLLQPLLELTGLTQERLILVPGNHDIDRDLIDDLDEVGMQGILSGLAEVDAFVGDDKKLTRAEARLGTWHEFYKNRLAGVDEIDLAGLGRARRLEINGHSVGVAALDSAWRSQGGDADKGRLLVSRRQGTAALEAIDGCDLRIVVVHHPLTWLAPFDGDWLKNELEREATVVLSGHEHKAEPTNEVTPRGGAIYARAGCLYQTRAYPNSYSLIDLDPEASEARFELRTWQPNRADFDLGVDIAQGGKVNLPLQQANLPITGQPAFSSVLSDLADIAQHESLVAEQLPLQPSAPDDFLVPPRFWPLPYAEMKSAAALDDDHEPARARPADDLRDGKVVVVSGDVHSGVSSALVWLLGKQFELDGSRAPAYLRWEGENFKVSRFEKALRRALNRTGFQIEVGDELPPAVIAIDDVPGRRRPAAVQALAKYMSEHPDNQYIVGCHGAATDATVAAIERTGLPISRAYLGPLGRRELRLLVEKTAGGDANGDLTSRILDVTSSPQLPRSPFVVVALTTVLSNKTDIKNLNGSGLLEAYVGLLLGHEDLVDEEGLAMDFRKREHLLSALGAHMFEAGQSRLSPRDIEEFVMAYFRQRDLDISPGGVVHSLVNRRILVRDDEGVGFRQAALQRFFAGKWMAEDRDFARRALKDPVEYAAPIQYAAGLRRADNELLRIVAEHMQPALQAADSEINIGLFDAIGDRPGWTYESTEALELVDRLSERGAVDDDPEAAEELLDKLDERFELLAPAEDLGLDLSPVIEDLLPELVLVSQVLRSSELVDDADLKRQVMRSVLRGWALMDIVLAVQEDQTARVREKLRSAFDDPKDAEKFERFAELLLTYTVIHVLHAAMGAAHLEGGLRDLLDDPTFMEDSAQATLCAMLYALLKGPGWPERLGSVYRQNRGNPLIRDLLNIHMVNAYLSAETPAAEVAQLEGVLGDIAVAGDGTTVGRISTQVRAATKSQAIQNLKQKRLNAVQRHRAQAKLDTADLPAEESPAVVVVEAEPKSS